VRYRGQGYELNVPEDGKVTARFHREHQRRYGYHHPGRETELVTIRLRARMRVQQPEVGRPGTARKPSRRATAVERAPVFFSGKMMTTPVYERADLVPGKVLRGPAVITEYSATTVVPPGKRFWVDRSENLRIAIQ
jgi:N-methylhydantoinase A